MDFFFEYVIIISSSEAVLGVLSCLSPYDAACSYLHDVSLVGGCWGGAYRISSATSCCKGTTTAVVPDAKGGVA